MPLSNEELEQRIVELTETIATLDAVLNERVDAHPPIGAVILLAGTTPPAGYMLCNGRAVRRDRYADLFALIGVSWGSGDGAKTFNIPDLRGQFLRVHNPRTSTGMDRARVLGALQGEGTRLPDDNPFWLRASSQPGHTHSVTKEGVHTHDISSVENHKHVISESGTHSHVTSSTGGHTHSVPLKTGEKKSSKSHGNSYYIETGFMAEVVSSSQRTSGPAGQHAHAITTDGGHIHDLRGAGSHSHNSTSAGSHSHSLGVDGSHSHSVTISGGDSETRPTNHALAAFIRTGQ